MNAAAVAATLPRWRRPLPPYRRLHAALVVCLAVAVYLPALRNDFAYDDVAIVGMDERVRNFDVSAILYGGYWQDSESVLYRPLTTLSYALDWQISDGMAAWPHLVNAAWHGIVTVLVLCMLTALRAPPTAALLGTAVFAVHPLHVEAVANIVGRAELMAAAFMLGAALLFTRPTRAIRTRGGLALLLALFAAALLSKETAVVLPGLLVLVDLAAGRLRPGRVRTWLRLRGVPLLALGATLVLYFGARKLVLGALTPADLDPSLEVLGSPVHRIYTALQAWPQYARLLFYPRVLLADYGPRIMLPATGISAAVLLGAALLVACLTGALLAWQRHRGLAAAALLWFPIAILPASNLLVPIGVLVAERTLYVPSVALSLAIVAAAPLLPRHAVARPAQRLALAAVIGLMLGLCAARTLIRIPDWRTTNTIFFALLQDRPDSFRAIWHSARIADRSGAAGTAMRLYADAIRLWPYRPRLLREAVLHAAANGRSDWSRQLSEFALERVPGELDIRRFHAASLLEHADSAAARAQIMEGLKWHPQDSLLLKMLHAATPSTQPDSDDGS